MNLRGVTSPVTSFTAVCGSVNGLLFWGSENLSLVSCFVVSNVLTFLAYNPSWPLSSSWEIQKFEFELSDQRDTGLESKDWKF